MINPKPEQQSLALRVRGAPGVTRLQAIRTSATEDCRVLEPVAVSDGKAACILPGQCVVTLTSAKDGI